MAVGYIMTFVVYNHTFEFLYIYIYELSYKNFNVTLTMAEDDV